MDAALDFLGPRSRRWTEPLDPAGAAPCGPDLEYDNDFLALQQLAAGKPETQFAPAEPPDWRAVAAAAEALLDRSRDLRVALLWLRAQLRLAGFASLPEGLCLVAALLQRFPEALHPQPDPDDGDAYARLNALAQLRDAETVLGDVRQAVLVNLRGIGELRPRDIELAHGLLPPREADKPQTKEAMAGLLGAAVQQEPDCGRHPARALAMLKALIAQLNERYGSTEAPDLRPLYTLLNLVATQVPAVTEAADDAADGAAADGAADASTAGPSAASRLSGSVQSRDDAVRAIDMVCDYLERAEPTNPAPLLLRRARRLVNRNFLQLLKELAPDSLGAVAQLMGVDPETVQLDGTD